MEIKSSEPNKVIPDDVSVPQFVLSRAAQYGERPFIIDDVSGKVLTYKQLVEECYRFAAGLHGLGLRPGDKVAVCLLNCLEFPVIQYGTLICQATIVGILTAYTVYESSSIYEDSEPKFVFTDETLLPTVKEATKQCKSLQKIILVGEAVEGLMTYDMILNNDYPVPDPVLPPNPEQDIFSIVYTTGSTGKRKGVKKTHHNFLASMIASRNVLERKPCQDVTIYWIVFGYTWGQDAHLTAGVYMGETGILIKGHGGADIETTLKAIQKYKVTYLICNTVRLLDMVNAPLVSEYDTSSMTSVEVGGSPLLTGLPEKLFAKYPDVNTLTDCIGASETTLILKSKKTRESINHGAKLAANVTAKVSVEESNDLKIIIIHGTTDRNVVDPESMETLGPHVHGELWLRGPTVCAGYLNRPDADAEAFTEDGWFRTGDIMYYNEDEDFFVVDRISHMIKYGQRPISPSEMEAAILQHPGVLEVAVIGIPDPVYGETPRAYVVLKPGHRVTEEDIENAVKARSNVFQLFGGAQFVDDLPKSSTGKILRKVVKAKYVPRK